MEDLTSMSTILLLKIRSLWFCGL